MERSIGLADAAQDHGRKTRNVFGQADISISKKFSGAGLGLPITISLMRLHQGRLTIDSVSGKGTTARAWSAPQPVVFEEAAGALTKSQDMGNR